MTMTETETGVTMPHTEKVGKRANVSTNWVIFDFGFSNYMITLIMERATVALSLTEVTKIG